MTDRLLNPGDVVRANAQRRAGITEPRDAELERLRSQRYDDRPPLEVIAIGYGAPALSGDQTLSSTSFTNLTATTFGLSFGGGDDATWVVFVTYRFVCTSFGAAGTDVYGRIQVDYGDGTWRNPEADVQVTHGAVTAFGAQSFVESMDTGTALTLTPTAVFKVQGGSSIRIRCVGRIGTAGQTATVQGDVEDLNPHCTGIAIPYRRPR